jgi:hypothetical protein
MNQIFIGKFCHSMPANSVDKEGNRAIIFKYCFGPIESTIYGITKDNHYYMDYTFPIGLGEDELEHDYRIISKLEMLKAIYNEIELCERNGGYAIAEALKSEKAKIEEM